MKKREEEKQKQEEMKKKEDEEKMKQVNLLQSKPTWQQELIKKRNSYQNTAW